MSVFVQAGDSVELVKLLMNRLYNCRQRTLSGLTLGTFALNAKAGKADADQSCYSIFNLKPAMVLTELRGFEQGQPLQERFAVMLGGLAVFGGLIAVFGGLSAVAGGTSPEFGSPETITAPAAALFVSGGEPVLPHLPHL